MKCYMRATVSKTRQRSHTTVHVARQQPRQVPYCVEPHTVNNSPKKRPIQQSRSTRQLLKETSTPRYIRPLRIRSLSPVHWHSTARTRIRTPVPPKTKPRTERQHQLLQLNRKLFNRKPLASERSPRPTCSITQTPEPWHPPSKKPAVPTPVLKAAAKNSQQSKKPQDSSSDPSCDNNVSKPLPAKKRATARTTPNAHNGASSDKKAAAKRDEFSSSDSSDEDEPQKTTSVTPRSAAVPPTTILKATPAKPQKDDSDSSTESEDDQPLKKIAKPEAASTKKTLKIVNRKPPVTFVIRQGTAHPTSAYSRHVHASPIKPFRHVPSYANVSKTFPCAEHYDHGTWSPRRGVGCEVSAIPHCHSPVSQDRWQHPQLLRLALPPGLARGR
ncbi:hypothetical protein MTO96_011258 [Rhipicephalus appendiculatus]